MGDALVGGGIVWKVEGPNNKIISVIFIYLLQQKVAKKCKHKTHTKYNTSIGQSKHILDMNSLCKKNFQTANLTDPTVCRSECIPY